MVPSVISENKMTQNRILYSCVKWGTKKLFSSISFGSYLQIILLARNGKLPRKQIVLLRSLCFYHYSFLNAEHSKQPFDRTAFHIITHWYTPNHDFADGLGGVLRLSCLFLRRDTWLAAQLNTWGGGYDLVSFRSLATDQSLWLSETVQERSKLALFCEYSILKQ